METAENLPQKPPIIFDIKDRDGKTYQMKYWDLEQGTMGTQVEFTSILSDIMRMARDTFPNYTEEGFLSLEKKLCDASTADVVLGENGKVVGFHVYKKTSIVESGKKVMFVDHAGTHPSYEGKWLTTSARLAIFGHEKPDIICGSSYNVYSQNKFIADKLGYELYPTGSETPGDIFVLAKQIENTFHLDQKASLDNRLVRTYPSPVSQNRNKPHPLQKILKLGPNDHVFYMLVRKN